jgi:hypothetical protein
VDWFEEKFGEFSDGVRMLRNSLRFLLQHPETLLPLIVIWLLSVYFVFEILPRVPWRSLEWPGLVGIVYLLNCGLCLLQLMGCSILLELLQHIETGKPMQLGRPVFDTLVRNIWAIVPLALVWSLVEVALWIVEAILTSGDRKSASSRAVESFFDFLTKGLRLSVYLALPAIAWEEVNAYQAVRRAIRIIRTQFASFLGALTFSGIFFALVGLPMGLVAYFAPDWVKAHWKPLLIYSAMMWTLKTYLEQMMMAELYLWVRCNQWDDYTRSSDTLSRHYAEQGVVPSLFNGVPDLLERKMVKSR